MYLGMEYGVIGSCTTVYTLAEITRNALNRFSPVIRNGIVTVCACAFLKMVTYVLQHGHIHIGVQSWGRLRNIRFP